MAYNPFNIFRRNQKVIFAVLTVFIMIMFTLSSGVVGGDFFEWLPRMLGAKGKRGEAICTIDGKKIYEGDLTSDRSGISYQRVMANKYMSQAAAYTSMSLDQVVAEQINRMSPEGQRMMAPVRQAEGMIRLASQDPRLAMQIGLDIPTELQRMRLTLSDIVNHPSLKNDDKEVARAKLAILMLPPPSRDEQYFLFAPNRTRNDQINFLLWQKKADQLGIYFTTEDIKQIVQREFFGYFTASSQILVQKTMAKDMPGFTMDACLKAVGEEFRVRAAQTAVLGNQVQFNRADKTYGGFPAFSTPFDSFDFFREECSQTMYGAIPVPAANYINRIPDPADNDPELQKLYQQYKDEEPNPNKETPGFKEPRKARVEFFSVNGSEAYYTKLAEEQLKLGEPVAQAGSMLTVPLFGGSPFATAASMAPVVVKDILLENEYEQQHARMHRSDVDIRWNKSGPDIFGGTTMGWLLDTSVVRPGNVAVTAGSVAGQLAGFGNPFAVVAAAGTGPFAYEIRDRAKAGVPALLAALGTMPAVTQEVVGVKVGKAVPAPLPGPSMLNSIIGAEVAYRMMIPKPLPLDAFRPTLMKDLLARDARKLAVEDVQKFLTEVNKLSENGKAKDKAAAQKFIDEFVARRGLKVAGNETPRSEWNLEEDPALAPLVTAQREMLQVASSAHGFQQQRAYVPFGEKFFWTSSFQTGRNPATGTLAPIVYPNDRAASEFEIKEKPQYVVWRKFEEQPKPRLFEAAKADVKLAYKRIKARELAKAEAEKLANTIRANDKTSEVLLVQDIADMAANYGKQWASDPKAFARVDPFVIRGVAPLTTVADPTGKKGFLVETFHVSQPGPMMPFNLPPSENLRYPTAEFRKTLLDDRTKGPKHVTVLTDAPKDTYFVVTLLKRELKKEFDYTNEVTGMMAQQFGGGMVLQEFRQRAERNSYQSIIALLKKEFKFEATEDQKKKLEENEKRGDIE